MLCGRGGQSDRLVRCNVCGNKYLASEIHRAARQAIGNQNQERSGMTAPITPPGNPDAKQPRPLSNDSTRDMGPGHVFGHLCDDPELRYTPTGRAVAKLRVAYTPRIKDENTGTWRDGETEFYTVNVWGQQAENCAEALVRGDRVVVAGLWTERTWTDREEQQRKSIELTAKDVGASLLFKSVAIKRTKKEAG